MTKIHSLIIKAWIKSDYDLQIGSCGELILNGVFTGTPPGIVNPEHNGVREIFDEEDNLIAAIPIQKNAYYAPNTRSLIGVMGCWVIDVTDKGSLVTAEIWSPRLGLIAQVHDWAALADYARLPLARAEYQNCRLEVQRDYYPARNAQIMAALAEIWGEVTLS